MTRWTPATHRDLTQHTDTQDLRALIVAALDAIRAVLPLLDDLTDTRQAGLGVTTRQAEAARTQHRARELAARYPTRRADGSMIAVGQRGLVRSDTVVTMPGARPVPVNLAAVSVVDEITIAVAHLNQRIRRRLQTAGVCHIHRPVDNPTPRQILDEARDLVHVVASRDLLLEIARTLAGIEGLADKACTIALGPDRVEHPRPCPHCGRHSLVVHLEAGITRCEGTHRCVCSDSYCDCRNPKRGYRHEWRRDAPSYADKHTRKTWKSRRESFDGLSRAQKERAVQSAARTATNEGAHPMQDRITLATEGATPAMARVLADIADERHHQVTKGWTADHDDQHDAHTLVRLAEQRAHMEGAAGPGYYDRHRIIQAAALLVAAVEVMDRYNAQSGAER